MGSFNDRIVMTDEERQAYEAWRDARTPYRDGSAQQRAFIAGRRSVTNPPGLEAVDEDPWAPTGTTVEDQCSECGRVGDMSVIAGDHRYEVELQCPVCKASTYVRVED